MGTVEPRYNDLYKIQGYGITDDSLAFIYGAIKKYGSNKEELPELKAYILETAKHIGE